MRKRAVIVASCDPSVEAAEQMLRDGGNVVDAAVAAIFATGAGEPSITSLAGGGMLAFHDARTGRTEVCDFFANAPGIDSSIDLPPAEREDDIRALDVLFREANVTQTFHVGRATAAVPGALRGLLAALDRWGALPLDAILGPTIDALRTGVPVNAYQHKCYTYLEEILGISELGRRCFFDASGHLIDLGDAFRNEELADTLETLAGAGFAGADQVIRDVIDPAILRAFGEDAGGRLTPADLDAWKPIFRPALSFDFGGARVDTNPPPSFGGPSVLHTLRLVEHSRLEETTPESAERFELWAAVLRTVSELRAEDPSIYDRDDAASRFRCRLDRILAGEPTAGDSLEPRAPGNTTHISVVDEDGNAAGVTSSHGEGNGHEIPGTGILMNNFLGESDLFPGGLGTYRPGARLSTMMAPTMLVDPRGSVTALGSGGANRIRAVISQVIVYLLLDGKSPQEAVDAVRIHLEDGTLSAETFALSNPSASLAAARRLAREFVAFEERGLFFGGVQVAQRRGDGTLLGGGDSRRNGIGRVVE